ncbi:hypothetical protein I302_109143 [Kwoniella bestiolae CBS 10118]|uniref:Uncharacterized protein n=1 Tax=Kwoniella bestiolae CBS 10118 TaxID=1296100 RepID=A0A1B9FV53_9TREE|nr:hypothetical protein I302_08289 [Kwoniella bestiolae CBS 10118]OCF22638.1 hypothetical protein I302_08289 [Kwoniella bestiolae CBS 10118]
MASLIVLSGVVGYYLYKENKTKKQNKLNGRIASSTTTTSAVLPSGSDAREAKSRELEHYGDIPPTYQHALIQSPSQHTHELSYTSSNSDGESPSPKPKEKNKRRSKFFGKRASSPKL